MSEHTCIVCGCTDSHACEEGCAWVSRDDMSDRGICTECVVALSDAVIEYWKIIPRTVFDAATAFRALQDEHEDL